MLSWLSLTLQRSKLSCPLFGQNVQLGTGSAYVHLWVLASSSKSTQESTCRCYNADIGKKEFQRLVLEAVDDITPDEADLLYRVFDTNRDGFVEMTELVRAGDKLAILSDDQHQWNYYNLERFD